jgi:hypothetical protein
VSEQDRQTSAGPGSRRQKLGKWAAGVIGTIVLAAIVAFSSGLGTKAAEEVGSSSGPPLTYSVTEQRAECFSGTFLPTPVAHRVLERSPPSDWQTIEQQPGAAAVGRDDIDVAIQGESERKITLTGIHFHVTQEAPLQGDVFYRACGGPFIGRALQVDLDKTPPEVTASSAEIQGMLEPEDSTHRLSRPIRFPWTVSVTDPLLLSVIATTERCYCSWTAEIPWVSGGLQGVIQIDDQGRPFRVVSGQGLASHSYGYEGGWMTRHS